MRVGRGELVVVVVVVGVVVVWVRG
jgi:hypothetical protein